MEQLPNVGRVFHIRMVAMLTMLGIADIALLVYAAESVLLEGPSVMLMFASEYLILLATLWATTVKYGLNVIDLRSEEPWEGKSMKVLYVDIVTGPPASLLSCADRSDFLKLVTYVAFCALILTFYGFPLNTFRDVYMTARSFTIRIRDLMRYHEATRDMDQRYPNATAAEMQGDRTCIICREDMDAPAAGPDQPAAPPAADAPAPAPAAAPRTSAGNTTPKKLPCGHVFHFNCLRSWLERQQSCPTWSVALIKTALTTQSTIGLAAGCDAEARRRSGAGATAAGAGRGAESARGRERVGGIAAVRGTAALARPRRASSPAGARSRARSRRWRCCCSCRPCTGGGTECGAGATGRRCARSVGPAHARALGVRHLDRRRDDVAGRRSGNVCPAVDDPPRRQPARAVPHAAASRATRLCQHSRSQPSVAPSRSVRYAALFVLAGRAVVQPSVGRSTTDARPVG